MIKKGGIVRKLPKPEDVFLDSIKGLVKNLLIDNPNTIRMDYSAEHPPINVINKEFGNFILDKINDWEHLVKPFEEEENNDK